MTGLKEKVQSGLDEARTLILGAEVLVGFEYNAVFQYGFDRLPPETRYLKGVALVLMLVALMLLMAPASFHRIAERGADTLRLHRFVSTVVMIALLPFACALGLDLYAMVQPVAGTTAAVVMAVAVVAAALFFWYGLQAVARLRHSPGMDGGAMNDDDRDSGRDGGGSATELKDRVRHVLTEARVVLPGAQALLGFQLIAMLTREFDRLPPAAKAVHIGSLLMIMLSTILLMSPASYHRIVNRGENTRAFERFAGRMVLAAMVPLALGICGDLYVVVDRIAAAPPIAVAFSAGMFVLFLACWFGLPLYVRRRAGGTS